MDQPPLQQTVIESREADPSFPQEATTALINTTSADISDITQEQAYEPLNYDELFPALPNANFIPASKVNTTAPLNNWTKNSDMRIASSVITQVFRVPYEERAKLSESSQFGEGGSSSHYCAEITAKSGAHIEISSAKDQSLTFLVTGKNDEVLKAKRMALEKFQTQARQSVKIPKEHYRFILGKKGKKLQELETSTNTKIQLPPPNNPCDEIIVIGTRDATEKAIHEIKLISDEQSKQSREKISIPKIYHPYICGPNNEWLNHFKHDSTVNIHLPPLTDKKDEIVIIGEKDSVLKSKDYILKKYKEMETKYKTVSVEVKKCQHKYVIGPRGTNVAEILRETNVSVEVPANDDTSETVTLRGPQEKLGQALTMVYAKANSVVNEEVVAPQWLHKFIIGRKGANIKQITAGVKQVNIVLDHGNIKLEGPPEEVQMARQKLETMINEFRSRLKYEELPVDPQYYKHIIGKNGSNVNRIRLNTQVHINIWESDGGKNIIRLEGGHQGVDQAKKELYDLINKMENEKEVSMNVEQRFHGNIIGAKGDKIREIRDRFNQVQISFPDAGEKSDSVKIRGPKEDVDKCARYLKQLGKELSETNYQVRVTIYRQFHKFIIGKGGSNISKIREETNTRIELPSERQNSDEIIITGKKENCEKAKERIMKIQNELANNMEVDIIIPARFHNALIGAGGKLIQSISEECGLVSIKFPPPDSKSDKVTIRGPKDDVLKAKEMLFELSNEKQLSSYTAEIRAKPQLHRFLIGKSGANIKKIRDKTGARIIFPTEKDENKEVITIIGKKESVESAKKELTGIIEELNKVVEMTTVVDPKHHRHFVARRGDVLRQISDEYGGVTISFPRQGNPSDKVSVKGSKDCVEGAIKRIQQIAQELDQMITLEVNIPQKYHRIVMGQRGSKVQSITSDYDVQVKFPERDGQFSEDAQVNGDVNSHPQDIVYVQGRKDKCEAAKVALLALIPVVEDVPVPFNHHRFIIGQKGETVRALMNEFDVNIQVPPAEEQKDSIRITGPRDNVDAAKSAILKKVEGSYHLYLRIDPEYHPKIIGHKGAVISRIRKKHDVGIRFPMKDSPEPDLITIVGFEKNCNDAKAAILTITGDLESVVKEPVEIDNRIHSRLIGSRGRAIRKIMEDYKVEIKFPRGEEDPNTVIIMGNPENVEDCRDHLLNLAEEYIQEIADTEDMQRYVKSNDVDSPYSNQPSQHGHTKGFVVSGAPWTQQAPNMESSEEFPSMNSAGSFATPTITPHWGPRSN